MSDVVIRSEQLGKKYLIGHQSAKRSADETFREAITRSLQVLGRSAIDVARGRQVVTGDEVEEFWALKDVSFEIKRGDVVGIIGRNGAGKSTLLKILSRITEPTEGRVEIKGRIASLLEVGTGFHPELSGRENIYLNGSILGMRRSEIRRKFDEIVAFAGIEKFLDTPVKRYSSGMYVRLAFAVAAHLEPEILVVDEVLAVGDVEFQKKCLGKISDISGSGRTVLFVSHNLRNLAILCDRGIQLDQGVIVFQSDIDSVLRNYSGPASESSFQFSADHDPSKPAQFLMCSVMNGPGLGANSLSFDRELFIELEICVSVTPRLVLSVAILAPDGTIVAATNSANAGCVLPSRYANFKANLLLPEKVIINGNYSLRFLLWDGESTFFHQVDTPALQFSPSESNRFPIKLNGFFQSPFQWKIIEGSQVS